MSQEPLEDLPEHLKVLADPKRETAINADALREYWGRWVAAVSRYVYAARFCHPYWSDTEWVMPHAEWTWRALIGIDLGYDPDPFAWTVQVYADEDPALWEISSGKQIRLTETEQLRRILDLCHRVRELGCKVEAVVVDAGGGGLPTVKGWSVELEDRLRNGGYSGTVPAVLEASKSNKGLHIKLLNADQRSGRLKCLRGSPLDVEQRYLQWKPRATERSKREEDSKRSVQMQDGTKATPGNHCCDARLYVWRHWYYAADSRGPSGTPPGGSHAAAARRNANRKRERLARGN